MARLRLFGPAREAAGRGEDELPGKTVAEVLAIASERYGAAFVAVAEHSVLWVNGEVALLTSAVEDRDELAVLPPISGG